MAADLIIMYRPVRDGSITFLENCRELGLKIILDIDDNLWRLPPGHPHEIDYLHFHGNLRKAYSMAHGIWTSTDPLMDFADARDGTGVVVPNAILEQDLPDKPSPYRGNVCWRGSLAQFMDIYSVEAVEMFNENREKFRHWRFWGYWPAAMRGQNVGYQRPIKAVEYMSMLPNSGINIMWKPLQDNEFNASKSNIAWIEATIAGGVCVTNFAGRPGWEMALDKFPDNPDFIAHQWKVSRDWILEHYNLKKVNQIRYDHIIKTLER